MSQPDWLIRGHVTQNAPIRGPEQTVTVGKYNSLQHRADDPRGDKRFRKVHIFKQKPQKYNLIC